MFGLVVKNLLSLRVKEIFRVLKPSGRFVVSDIILRKPLPEELEKDVMSIVGCIGRAVGFDIYKKNLEEAGFSDVSAMDSNKDLNTLYNETGENTQGCGTCTVSCCGKKQSEPVNVLKKYDLNEYTGSYIVKAIKK